MDVVKCDVCGKDGTANLEYYPGFVKIKGWYRVRGGVPDADKDICSIECLIRCGQLEMEKATASLVAKP